MSASPTRSAKGNDTANQYDKRVSTNTKVFRDLDRKLSSNNQEAFIQAADKLTKWLASEKAYYPEARPQIVSLLEAAAYTLARLIGLRLVNDFHISRCTPDIQTRAAAYTVLVETARPFLPLFPEVDLKTRLVNIFSTIHVSPQGSHPTAGTSALPARRPSTATADTPTASPEGKAGSSDRVTPVTPILPASSSTSSALPDSFGVLKMPLADLADPSATPREFRNVGQMPRLKDPFATASGTSSPSASLPDSPTTSSSPVLRPPNHKSFMLRKATFPVPDTRVEEVPAATASMDTPSSGPVAAPTASPGATPTASPHAAPTISQPTGQAAAPSVLPPVQSSSAQPPTAVPPSKRASLFSAKFERLAAIDKKSWKKSAQPKAVSQEPEKGNTAEDGGGESSNEAKPSVSVPSADVEDSPDTTVPMGDVQLNNPLGADSSPRQTITPHQPPIGAAEDTSSVDPVSVVEAGPFLASEATQQMMPLARENVTSEAEAIQSESTAGNDTANHLPSSGSPPRMAFSPPPPSHSQKPQAPTPNEDPVDEQAEHAPRPTELLRAGETSAPSTDNIESQNISASPRAPSNMEMDMSINPVAQTRQDDSVSSQSEGMEGASDLGVEQLAHPVELECPESASALSCITGTPAVDGQMEPHINETAPHQPVSTDGSVLDGESAEGGAIRCAPESIPSPSGTPADAVDPAPGPSSSQFDQTSVSQKDDTHAMAEMASPTPTSESGGSGTDTQRSMAAVAQRVSSEDREADKPDRVDGIMNLLSSCLKDVFASGLDGKLHAVLEASMQWPGGGQWEDSNTSIENEVTKGDGAASQTNHVHQSGGMSLSSGKKRARSSSSDGTTFEHPSNRPRRGTGTDIEEKSPPAATTDPSQGVQAESSTGRQEDVASAASARKQLIHTAGEDGIAENQESGQARSPDSLAEGRSPPRAGRSTRHAARGAVADLPLLKPGSYHPSQPYEIISIVEGSPMAAMQDVQFELSDEKATLVKRWVDRYDTFDQNSPCMSFTLICTHLPVGQTEDEKAVTEEIAQNMEIQWPRDGGVWITVEADDHSPISIPVSPPSYIEGHEALDLSDVVGGGTTKIRFTQTRDLSQYLFILRAHRPTEAQLRELDISLAGQKWTKTLARLAAPLPAHVKDGLFSTPASE
ncbi:hypothetical protein JB92DRAFT_2929258 [Gautieria morchelliformis]|nr:hypothetical protein JB92DRAFT_2929258 [Gautieria morchelliformis]